MASHVHKVISQMFVRAQRGMGMEDTVDVVKRYIEDCVASERNVETHLRNFAKDDRPEVQRVLIEYADQTKAQRERLDARLREIGGPPSTLKSFMTHMLGVMPQSGRLGTEDEERDTQELMMAYAFSATQQSMYEVLCAVANTAGDTETERLARGIQDEKAAVAAKVWAMLAPAARGSFRRITEARVQSA